MSRRSAKVKDPGDAAQERRAAAEDGAIRSGDTEEKAGFKPCLVAPLSDSENEEPLPRRTLHRSAFVSKNPPHPFASSSWSLQSRLERSQSCSDHVTDSLPVAGRRRAPQLPRAKVVPAVVGGGLGGCAGVLLSTENSRSFSAPVLTSERRVVINPLNSFTPLHKPERSISPESNDSISEELNHFKPIVCSPCTPPKRLPDGQVLSPLIIKSTPRNLRRNLQKPTSYEASPLILKKWEQVFQDRQMKRTLSKGTLTSPPEGGGQATKGKGTLTSPPEGGGQATKGKGTLTSPPEGGGQATKGKGTLTSPPEGAGQTTKGKGTLTSPPEGAGQANKAKRTLPSPPEGGGQATKAKRTVTSPPEGGGQATKAKRTLMSPPEGGGQAKPPVELRLSPASSAEETPCSGGCLHQPVKDFSEGGSANPPPGTKTRLAARSTSYRKTICQCKCPVAKPLKRAHKQEAPPMGMPNGASFTTTENIISPGYPQQRRGQKRRCKTKHLEKNGAFKRLRVNCRQGGFERLWREAEKKLRQEEDDKKLALKLQRMFDKERRVAKRRKGGRGEYALRSKSAGTG